MKNENIDGIPTFNGKIYHIHGRVFISQQYAFFHELTIKQIRYIGSSRAPGNMMRRRMGVYRDLSVKLSQRITLIKQSHSGLLHVPSLIII